MNKKCQVFTPENYVIELLDSVGYTHNLYGKKILENSCGDGNILVAVVQRYIDDCKENGLSRTRIKNGLAKDIYGIEIDEEQYKKCIDNLDKVLKRNDIDKVDWKVINADNGKMSYLIPSSIYKTVFGHNLRIFMSPYIAQIKDYKQVKIFDKALVKSSIMVLDKQRQQELLHYQDMSMENAIDIPIAQLDEKWFFADENEVGQHRFGDYFKVSHVVATLLNKAYVLSDGAYTEVDNGYVCGNHTIEREVVRNTETPRTLRYIKHEKIIFPYTYNENELVHYDDGEFERLYPGATAYLNEFRDDLDKRQSDNNAKWYEYGRSQALSGLNRQKLLISTVVTNDVDVYELEQECIPYAGMYIVQKEDNYEYTLTDAMRILRSDEFKEYVFKIGIPISGKLVRITSKDVENYMF